MLNNLTNYLGGLPGSSLASSKLWQFLVKHTMTQTLIEVRYHTETPTKNEERTFFEGFPKVNNNSSKHCEPGVKSKYINNQNPLLTSASGSICKVKRVILRIFRRQTPLAMQNKHHGTQKIRVWQAGGVRSVNKLWNGSREGGGVPS